MPTPELSESERLFVALVNAGDHARRQGDRDSALGYFNKAALVLAEAGSVHPRLQSGFYSNFGILLMSLDQQEQAEKLQRKALEIDEAHGSATDVAFSLHNLAGVLRELRRNHEAVTCFKRALRIFEAEGLANEAVNTRGELATTLIEAGRLDEAEQYLG